MSDPFSRPGGWQLPPSPQASRELGRSARHRLPRRSLGEWDPARREVSALDRLRAQEKARDQSLLPLRYARMASSPWAYLRGAAAVMAADLGAYDHSGLLTQLCGDAHVLNFGLWASPERQLLFDLRDFDETHTGPFEWDVKRLATSLHVLADSEGVARTVADTAVEAMLRSYTEAIRHYAELGELDIWYDRITVDVPLSRLTSAAASKAEKLISKQVRKRSQLGAVEQVTEVVDGVRRITEDPVKRRRLAGDVELGIVEQVFSTYYASIPTYLHRLGDRLSKTDVVQQVVGVGSVGMRVYLWLAEGQSGRQPILFQIKQATGSVYEEFLEPSPFDNAGERVAVGQRLMQSATDIFLGFARVGEHDYYVRQFRDVKIIPDGPHVAPILPQFAQSCGQALAKSHARCGDPSAIAGYVGKGGAFRDGISAYARAYAAQTVTDHRELVDAVSAGRVEAAERGW